MNNNVVYLMGMNVENDRKCRMKKPKMKYNYNNLPLTEKKKILKL